MTRRTGRGGETFLLRLVLGMLALVMTSSCARLGDVSGPTPIGGTVATVTMAQPTVTLGVGATATLVVVARDDQGREINDRPVVWSTSDNAIVSVSPSGVLTAVSEGVAQVSASIAGRSASATVTVVQRPVNSIEIGPLAPRLLVGGVIQLVALPRDETGSALSNRPVFWSSSEPSVAFVDASGFVTGLSAGAATITARSESREAAVGVVVTAVPVASVIISPRVDTIVVGQSTQLNAVARDAANVPLVDRTFAWRSGASATATVSASGLVVGVTPGTVKIEAQSETVIGEATIVVQPRPIGAVIISPSQATLTVGEATSLTVQVTDANGNLLTGRTITYQSMNTGVAQVSTTGVVSAVGPGTTEIRASSEGRTGVMSITVRPTPVATVRVQPSTATLSIGATQQLIASALDAAGNVLPERAVSWTSGAPAILSVSASGLVNALAPGTGLIFATIDGRLASATITVREDAIGSVQVTPSLANVIIGQSVDLAAVVRNAAGAVVARDVVWSSSNSAIAVVSSSGRVRAIAIGTAQITATVDGVVGTAGISVLPIPVASVSVALATTTLNVGQTTQATATLRDSNGNVLTGRAIAWTTSNAAVATVSSTGLVTAVSGGTANIIATSENVTANAAVTVTQVAGTLGMQREPAGAVSGAPFTTQPIVRILDAQGNLVTTGPGSTLAVTAVRQAGSATLSGTTTVNAVAGVATFTNLAFGGLGTGEHRLRFTTSSPSLGVNSALFTVTAGPAATITAVSALTQTAQTLNLVAEPPSVRVTDAGGNPVSGVPVTFAVTAGLGTTNPASGSSVNTGATGAASLVSWRMGAVPGANRVRATAAGLTGSPITFEATATAGNPTQLAITRQPIGASSGTALTTQPIIEIRDAAGNRVPGATNAVTVSVESGGGSVGGTTTVNAVDGVATFTDLRLNGGGTKTLRFSAAGLTPVVSQPIPVNQSATTMRVQRQPAGAFSGIAFTTQPVVEILDAAGLVVTDGSGATLVVTATLASGTGELKGTSSATASSGVATFNNLSITGIGPHALRFATSSPALNVVSETFTLGSGSAAGIAAVSSISQTATVLSAVPAPPSVRVTDGAGNAVSGASVTFSLTSGGGSISPTNGAVTTNSSGVATLSSWTLGATAGANSITATATSGGNSIGSVTFSATGTAGAAASISAVSSVNQSAAVSSTVSSPPSVRVTDANGNAVSGVAVRFTVASGGGSTSPTSGSTVNTNASGLASLTSWTLGSTPGANTVNATVSGLSGSPVVFSATGTAAAATQLFISTQPTGAVSGLAFTTQPVVQIRDASNTVVTSSTAAVTVSITSGGGTLVGTQTVNAVNGIATFTNLRIDGPGSRTLQFTSSGLTSATSNALNVTQQAASLQIQTQPATTATSGQAFTRQPVVRILDNAGLVVTTGAGATLSVRAQIASGTGTLGGTTSVNAVNGVATFSNLSITGTGAHTLRFITTTPALSVVSASINAAPVATNIDANSITSQTGMVSTNVIAPSVRVSDASNNPVGGVSVTFSITDGDGSISPASPAVVITDASGIASLSSWTLGATAGINTVLATASGLAGSPVAFHATAPVATTLAANSVVTQTAITGTNVNSPPSVRVTDATGNPVAGTAVVFTVTSGGGSIDPASGSSVTTNASGIATLTRWTLGIVAGTNTVSAAVSGLAGSPVVFTATGEPPVPSGPPQPAALVVIRQPDRSASNTVFSQQPLIEVRDGTGARIMTSNLSVTVSIESGNGTLLGTRTVAAVNGVVTYTNLLIDGRGSHVLRFSSTQPALSVLSSSFNITPGGEFEFAAAMGGKQAWYHAYAEQ